MVIFAITWLSKALICDKNKTKASHFAKSMLLFLSHFCEVKAAVAKNGRCILSKVKVKLLKNIYI